MDPPLNAEPGLSLIEAAEAGLTGPLPAEEANKTPLPLRAEAGLSLSEAAEAGLRIPGAEAAEAGLRIPGAEAAEAGLWALSEESPKENDTAEEGLPRVEPREV
jgi:hypothetical protein